MPNLVLPTGEGPTCCAQRWLLAYMGLWMGIMTYMLNSNMSIAAVCMVRTETDNERNQNGTTVHEINNGSLQTNVTLKIPVLEIQNISDLSKDSGKGCVETQETLSHTAKRAEFDWDKKTRSFILSSYFYGYMVTQIPGGWLTSKFGGKHVIGTFMALSSALTLLMPVFARSNVYLLIVARAMLGMALGMVIPGYCGLVGIWALPTERSRFMALCLFGQMVGVMLGYSTSGLLCVHGFDNGWPSIFYVHGAIGALFVLTWCYVIHASPQQHPRITEKEKQLLLTHSHTQASHNEKNKVPWKKIFTYMPVYAIFITHTCDNWTHYLILTCLPQFFKEVLKLNIQSNGFFSCLPFLSLMVGIAFAGIFADLIRKQNCLTITTIRKLFQLVGLFGVTVFILIPGHLTCDQKGVAIMCLCLCTLFQGAGITGGYTCNAIDIAPRYGSIIFAVSNSLASIPGIIAPLAVAEITENQTSGEWRVVFYMCAGVSLFAALVYGVFSSSELAPWADVHLNKEIAVYETNKPSAQNENFSKPKKRKGLLKHSDTEKDSEVIVELCKRER